MSKAIICDKCGRVMPPDGDMRSIWTESPIAYAREGNTRWVYDATLHLCNGCYAQFEREYMANLNDIGEAER